MFCCIVIPDFHPIFVVLLFRHKISSPNFFPVVCSNFSFLEAKKFFYYIML